MGLAGRELVWASASIRLGDYHHDMEMAEDADFGMSRVGLSGLRWRRWRRWRRASWDGGRGRILVCARLRLRMRFGVACCWV